MSEEEITYLFDLIEHAPKEKRSVNAWGKLKQKLQAFTRLTDAALLEMDQDLKAGTSEEQNGNCEHQQEPHTNEI